jgi:hypothetical protein
MRGDETTIIMNGRARSEPADQPEAASFRAHGVT